MIFNFLAAGALALYLALTWFLDWRQAPRHAETLRRFRTMVSKAELIISEASITAQGSISSRGGPRPNSVGKRASVKRGSHFWEVFEMKDIFAVVTAQIISQLEQGIVPWRRPWDACWPTSYQANKEYRGINVLLLQSRYTSPYWLTFRQAQRLGGSIKAGEKGTPHCVR